MPELRPRVSYAELVRFPDDGRRFELHGGQDIFGAPLTAALAIDGVTTQYFEHVRLELENGGEIAVEASGPDRLAGLR